MNESEDDQLDVGTLDPLNQVNVVEDLNKKAKICSTGPAIRHIRHCIQIF